MTNTSKTEVSSAVTEAFDTPVLLIIFNRPEKTKRVFEAIKKQKPKFLYVAADGPRPGNIEDFEKCKAAREVIQVDWDCEFHTQYRDENRGCGKGPAEAITWFFENVEHGIILEDDSVPHTDFFVYCSELLYKYKDVKDIKVIGSANFQPKTKGNKFSYYFSMQNGCFCSWATWRRTWQEYDYFIKKHSVYTLKESLKYYKVTLREHVYWLEIFRNVKNDRFRESSWDYQLMFSIWKAKGIGIVPNVNLATNIGFDEDATHTFDKWHLGANRPSESILPLVHPDEIEINRNADLYYFNFYYQGIKKGKKLLIENMVLLNKLIKSFFNINQSWLSFNKQLLNRAFSEIRKFKTELRNRWIWNKQGRILRKKILQQYNTRPIEQISREELEVVEYLKRNKIALLPYQFVKNYKTRLVDVEFDLERSLYYVIYNNKRLYFRKDWNKKKIAQYYANLLAEQDQNSPHLYLTREFDITPDSVIIDAGAAEGIFALMVIEKAKYIYIVEPDPFWIEAIEATFEPWKEKVEIIQKYIASEVNISNITLDSMVGETLVDFIKIDVEGYEQDVFHGASNLLNRNYPMKIVVATYHRHNDEIALKTFLESKGFNCTYSIGFIPYYYQTEFEIPYMRRCLIRSQKEII